MTTLPESAGEAVPETDPLLASKLAVPQAPPFTVERARLLDQLTHAVRNPMTVVTGPPGSGKTQLAASWVSSGAAPGPVVWFTLEDEDNDPAVFWPYLIEGLRRGGVTLSSTIYDAVRGEPFDRSLLARLAADLASWRHTVVLVLDSVTVLTDRQLAEDLDALVRHADHHLRMVLVGRWDPPLPLYRYRLSAKLSEIRGDDLAFTAAEAAMLLAGHAVELPDWAINSLVQRTEGWAVGLRLFAMAMEGRADAEDLVVTIAGDDTNLADYFLGEVLAAQPQEVREFLLRTSIVDDFTPELAEALFEQDGARHILAKLERANAFVQPVAARSNVHRYHPLFAELLRAQLTYEYPAKAALLHRRAAAWLLAHGQIADAIRHSVGAKDWQHACTLVVQDLGIGRLLTCDDTDRLAKLFKDMPTDVEGPEAAAVLAARRLAGAEPAEALKLLGLVTLPAEADVPLRLAVALLGAVAAEARRDDRTAVAAAETAEILLAQAPPDRVAAHPELYTVLSLVKGSAQSRSGDLIDAIATLNDGTGGVQPTGCDGIRLAALEQLALACAYQGLLQNAGDAAARAANLAGQRRRRPARHSAAASAVLAWVATERWAVADAWRHLRAAEVEPGTDDPMTTVAIALVRSRLLSGRGELRAAARVLGDVRTADDATLPAWLKDEITSNVARLEVAMGHPDDALATVGTLGESTPAQAAVVRAAALIAGGEVRQAGDEVRPVVETTGLPTPLVIEAWLLLAVVAGDGGEADPVRDALGQAMELAAMDGHRRAFHQAGPWLRHLLRNDAELAANYQALSAAPAPRPRVPAVAGPPDATVPILVEALSERELEVLRHLAAMMGTEEIADAMYLSVNTVKTHVRNILRKLAASRRNEAVRRARALGIV